MLILVLLFTFAEANGNNISISYHANQSSSISIHPHQSYPSCFTEGTTWSTEEAIDIVASIPSLYSCQDRCIQSIPCRVFTWYDSHATSLSLACFLFEDTSTSYPCSNCVSGPQYCRCQVPEPQDHGAWFCPSSSSPSTCHLECDPGYVSDNVTLITCDHGEWSSAPRCVAAVALITGNFNSPQNTAEIYGEGLHKKLADLPSNRYLHTLHVVNSVVLLCGGYSTGTSCLEMTSSHFPTTSPPSTLHLLEWRPHSSTTSPRWSHSSASMLGTLHLLGGAAFPSSSTEVLQPPSDQSMQSWSLIEDNYGSCTAKVDPLVFIMTGGGYHPRSVVAYNITSGAATRLQDLITGRFHHGCVYVKEPVTMAGGLLVAGGNGGDGTSEMYDMDSGEWVATGELTSRRGAGMRMVVLGGNVLAMGGGDGTSVLATVDTFNTTSRQWRAGEDMLEPRYYHAVTGVPPNAVGIA